MSLLSSPPFSGRLRCPPLSSSPLSTLVASPPSRLAFSAARVAAAAVAISNAHTRERQRLKELFKDAQDRCLTQPTDGVAFTEVEFLAALDKYDHDTDIGTKDIMLELIQINERLATLVLKYSKIRGTVFMTDVTGALVDIPAKSSAYLPVQEACIHKIKHVAEAGICPGFQEEFVIIGENAADDSRILSLRSIQYDLAWERCRQLQAEDAVVKGKIIGGNKGGVIAIVECLNAFIPFSQILTKSTAEELIHKELPLKFVEVNEELGSLILSNRKAIAETQTQIEIGSVVVGTVQSLKPYGAFVDLGGINGLLHVSQISHDRISDITTVLQPGDTLKVMILSQDRDKGRVSLSTKKLEPTPGDMIRNPKLVFEKADEMAQNFRQRIAQAEEMARADMLKFQPESRLRLGCEGILEPLSLSSPKPKEQV